MEDTYALLSKLVQTKSIERVLAPIAAQVSQLIIINEAYEHGDKDAFPADLVPSASMVRASTDGLVEAASRLAVDSSDKELHNEMPRACELLTVAGQSLVLATQRVQIENFSRESRRHLIRTARDVLQATLKVMLVTDDAEIRKLKKAIHWTRERLGLLTAVQSMKNLVPAFKGFTEAVILLTNLVDKRQLELSDPQQREAVLNSLAVLKKCVPMLNSSLQTYTKYPQNAQAKASKLYVLGEILDCLECLEQAVHSKDMISEDVEAPETSGSFVTSVDRVIEMLSSDGRLLSAQMGTDLDFVVEGLVRHAMEVAHHSMEHHRGLIIKNAQRLLKQRTQLCEMSKNVRDNHTMTELKGDFDDACERLIAETQDLERHVHGAILHLVVDVFKETTEPLERTIKVALSSGRTETSADDTHLEQFTELFHQHSDKMIQVARFTAATSLDSKKVRTVNTCVSHLERLDPEIVPAALACRDTNCDKAAVEHLRLLKKEWASTVDVLVQIIDDLIDGKMFIEISECEIRQDVSKCKESLYCEEATIADVTRSLIGRARRVSQRATHTVDQHADALYRNGVMAYINQLNKVIPSVKSSANSIMEDLSNEQHHKVFHRRCDSLLRQIGHIKDALLGNILPDLLDPIRDNVRPVRSFGKLDFDEDGSQRMDLDSSSPSKADDKKKNVQEIVAERTAVKSYISDIVHSPLRELMSAVYSAAVAGQRKKLDTLCSSIVEISNHFASIVESVSKYCTPHQARILNDQSSTLVKLTPQVLEKSRQVANCDTYQLDPLRTATDEWAKTVSNLEQTVDPVLSKWKTVADKLIDAAIMANKPLLMAQKKHFDEHNKNITEILDTALRLVESVGVIAQEKVRQLQANAGELGNITSMLVTMAELHVSTGTNSDNKGQLERSGRDWAAKVYTVTAAIDVLSAEAVEEIRGRPIVFNMDEMSLLDDELREVTKKSLRMKESIESALNGCNDESRIEEGKSAQSDLDLLSGKITECSQLLTHVATPYETTEKMYAPHMMSLVLWEWAVKVQQTRMLIEKWTSEFTEKMGTFIFDVKALHEANSEDQRQMDEIKCRRFVTFLRESLHKIRSKVLDAIQTSDDLDGKNRSRRHLEALGDIADKMEATAKGLISVMKPEDVQTFEELRRRWGTKCLEMRGELMRLHAADTKVVTEAVQSMRLQELTPKVKVTSSFGYHGNKPGGDTSVGSKQSTTNHNNTTATSFHDSPQTKSWRDISTGPKVHHGTPARPSENSGYKPKIRPFSAPTHGSPFSFPLESEKWEDEDNAIVRVARELAHKLQHMTQYTKGQGPIVNKEQLISTARAVASNGETLVKFARVLVAHSIDKRIADDLQSSADRMPTIIAQLNILATVKTATPDDRSTEKMLVKTSENLVEAINKMLRNAEAACVKGLRPNSAESAKDDTQALVLATQWRRKFNRHRLLEYSMTSVDDLGLRKVKQQSPAPALSNIMMQR